jgi:predicted N-acyltransferase
MPDGGETVTARVVDAIAAVPEADWDACAGIANPFVSHAFLKLLEDSGSARPGTGWAPRHIVVSDRTGRIVGCAPLYAKAHSLGEYVFDWNWAEAYQQAGGIYYPKLQLAVPFTPVTGPRLLVRPGAPPGVEDALAAALVHLAQRLGVSSVHVTFAAESACTSLAQHGFLERIGYQYHWHNHGYGCFDDFLAALASRKRKAIRKERAEAAAQGLTLKTLTGAEIGERHWVAFERFYRDTAERKWAHAYLTRDFFTLLGERMAERIVLVVAETAAGDVVAGALNLLGSDTLFGRYWGCDAAYRFLHFEACYYRAIEFAIERRLKRVEAGAQGEHKIQRGYLPCTTHSAHWIADPGFRRAVARFLAAEREAVAADIQALAAHSPYRHDARPAAERD